MTDLPESLLSEIALREKRARAVAEVRDHLRAARAEAEGQCAASATVVAGLRLRVDQLHQLRGWLEAEHAAALAPAAAVQAAEAALQRAAETSRQAPPDDEAAANAAADAHAEAEEQLATAKRAQARTVRPLALRLDLAIEQVGDAERELEAAQAAHAAANQAARAACIELLRLRRDAALLAFDEATVDLGLTGCAEYSKVTAALGESRTFMTALGEVTPDHDFGFSSQWRAQHIGRQDAVLVLDQVAGAAVLTDPAARRPGRKATALLDA